MTTVSPLIASIAAALPIAIAAVGLMLKLAGSSNRRLLKQIEVYDKLPDNTEVKRLFLAHMTTRAALTTPFVWGEALVAMAMILGGLELTIISWVFVYAMSPWWWLVVPWGFVIFLIGVTLLSMFKTKFFDLWQPQRVELPEKS